MVNLETMRKQDPHLRMFQFDESTGNFRLFLVVLCNVSQKNYGLTHTILASRGGNYSIGRQLNITDGVSLSDLDEYDLAVIKKIEHSAKCSGCRRLFSTLAFHKKLLKQNAFVGIVAEWLKTLASSFCRSK